MTRTDRKILFTALAFFAVIIRGKEANSADAAEDIRRLAGLVESYCSENVIKVSASVSDETGTLVIDQLIERHIAELRENEMTVLPDDRATLIKVLDRLEQRKIRRSKRELYAFATEERLADLVLGLFDEEIEDEGKTKLA